MCTKCHISRELINGKCEYKPKTVNRLQVTKKKFDQDTSTLKLTFSHRLQKKDFKTFLSVTIESKNS